MNKCACFPRYGVRESGLTLLELLLVLSVSMILLFSVTTSYRQWVVKNQLTTLVNTLRDSLEYARNTAMTLHTTVVFCPKDGGDWESGQLIKDANTQRIFRELPMIPRNYRIDWRSSFGASADLRFDPDGFTHGQQGSFFICSERPGEFSARIVLLRTGRMRVEMGSIAACGAGF